MNPFYRNKLKSLLYKEFFWKIVYVVVCFVVAIGSIFLLPNHNKEQIKFSCEIDKEIDDH